MLSESWSYYIIISYHIIIIKKYIIIIILIIIINYKKNIAILDIFKCWAVVESFFCALVIQI